MHLIGKQLYRQLHPELSHYWASSDIVDRHQQIELSCIEHQCIMITLDNRLLAVQWSAEKKHLVCG